MMDPRLEILLSSARDAFLQVSVFVALMVLLFSWLQYKTSGKFVSLLQKNKKIQPFFGALLGLTPGCGGAIIVMPLYVKKVVTFGTVIATLAATLGDAAFILIAKAPKDALVVHVVAFVTAILWGIVIDKLKITHRQPLGLLSKKFIIEKELDHEIDPKAFIKDIKGEEKSDSLGYKITHRGYILWWWVCFVGLILGVTLLVKASDPDYGLELTLDPSHQDAIFNYVGLFGTFLSLVLFVAGKHFIGDDTLESLRDKLTSSKETLIHAASETAFVTFWVLCAYLIFEYSMYFSEVNFYQAATVPSVWAVLVGAGVGLIPGCGPQILFVAAYTEGLLPMSVLIAHAISQDGDALFPLLARNKKAALWSTVITTIPAILVGVLWFYFMGN